jgi:hypothetical protein
MTKYAMILVACSACSTLPEPDGWFWVGAWTAEEKESVSAGAVEGGGCMRPATDQSYPYSMWDDQVLWTEEEPVVMLPSGYSGYRLYASKEYPLKVTARLGFQIICADMVRRNTR